MAKRQTHRAQNATLLCERAGSSPARPTKSARGETADARSTFGRYMATSAQNSAQHSAQRAIFLHILGGKCAKCGTHRHLEIDHIDPSTKVLDLSRRFSARTISAALDELKKCQALCHRHHLEKTATESAVRRLKPINHGTMYAWMKLKCGCEKCSAAKWAWHDARNEKRSTSRHRKARQIGRMVNDTESRPSRLDARLHR